MTNPPSIVLILVDDADSKVLGHGASSKIRSALLVGEGSATATRYLASHPLCAPSRASILRGMYPHNTGVDGNSGAYHAFKQNDGEDSNIAVWLNEDAPTPYRTGFLGKYINGYDVDETHHPDAPRGWDDWHVVGRDAYDGTDYWMNDNGTAHHHGSGDEHYLTNVLRDKALDFLNVESSQPFFLMINPMAPHSPSFPAELYQGTYSTQTYPKLPTTNPSFNEANVSDKPYYVSNIPSLTLSQQHDIDIHYQGRLECMLSVGDLVQAVVGRLLDIDPGLSNTYVFFTSDHGYHMGEHRLGNQISQDDADGTAPGGKNSMYEEDIRVPLWVRGPGIPEDTVITELLGNVDLAPTFCDIAGIEWETSPPIIDGRSFLPLLHGQSISWRKQYLISRGQTKTYAGIRSADEWVFGELDVPAELEIPGEYYNLTADAPELNNGYNGLSSGRLSDLQAVVADYRACEGVTCRIHDSVTI